MYEPFIDLLSKCAIFKGIPREQLEGTLTSLNAKLRRYRKGEIIFSLGDRLTRGGIVLEGEVEVGFMDDEANEVNMNHFTAGHQFGNAMACTDIASSPIQMRAVTDCAILYLDFRSLLNSDVPLDLTQQRVAANLIREFAARNVFLNEKVRILSQKRLRARIRIFLAGRPMDADGIVRLPFSKKELASYLGVDRTAFFRELARMRDEGILETGRDYIRVLDAAFLK
ncbi:MAG: Crp/Fnr family transcriptional regulator [Clostridia bacterium]|nr:Crp/Fnr family transcriptional regulator [Clostridia bacterium]